MILKGLRAPRFVANLQSSSRFNLLAMSLTVNNVNGRELDATSDAIDEG